MVAKATPKVGDTAGVAPAVTKAQPPVASEKVIDEPITKPAVNTKDEKALETAKTVQKNREPADTAVKAVNTAAVADASAAKAAENKEMVGYKSARAQPAVSEAS